MGAVDGPTYQTAVPAYAASMQPENLEPRVTALEGQVGELRGEVAAIRGLARAVDRDVSEMRGFRRATIASFNALRADMVDMRQDMNDLRQDVGNLRQEMGGMRQDMNDIRQDMNDGFRRADEQFAQVNNGFIEMRGKFDITAAGQQRIVELIQQAIDTQGGAAPA